MKVVLLLACAAAVWGQRADLPPRKVIVGTAMQQFWKPGYPGLEKRIVELNALLDEMAAAAKQKYGRGLDIAVLPELAVTGEGGGDLAGHSVRLDGMLRDAFGRKARELRSYLVVPAYLAEGRGYTNSAVLFDRHGEVKGIYRKLHPAVQTGSDSFEGGIVPGREVPVFECDFGKVGLQICFDIEFDYGWEELARKGADLVLWPTQSPQTVRPGMRARTGRYYVVSSTWRHNASVFDPTGKIVNQIKAPQRVLVEEVDLSYAILPWSSKLKNGAALTEKYGRRAGFRYYEDEDRGVFWSNDPGVPIGRMIRSLGLAEADREIERIRLLFRKAGVPGS
jgi:predicted amidohydrolase